MDYYLCDKPQGEIPTETLARFKAEAQFPINKICCAGRLDPMARGKLLVLVNEQCKNSSLYNKKDKIYEFSFVPGLTTDTTDLLGLIESSVSTNISNVTILNSINKFNGLTYEQEYHKFSSNTVRDSNGIKRPLYYFSRNNINVVVPKKSVTIYSMEHLDDKLFTKDEFETYVFQKLENLSIPYRNSFRHPEIVQNWHDYFQSQSSSETYTEYSFKAKVSAGVYIRQIVKDLSVDINIPLVTTDIYRTAFEF